MKVKVILISVVLALCLALQEMVTAKILFEDDFEKQELGKEPKGWKYDPAAEVKDKGYVDKDPTNPNNKVFAHYGGYSAGDGLVFTDFVAEWNWMYTTDENHSIGFRVEDAGRHYQLSRRGGGVDWKIYMYNGAWNEIVSQAFPTKLTLWYSVQLIAKGPEFTVKVKEKTDATLFADMKPTLKVKDDTYKKGMFQTSYYGPIDNVIIAEKEADILSIESVGKLSATWAKIKLGS
jgi:hypothetical protein